MPSPEHRRNYILKHIEDRGSATVVDLAEELDVSAMTIRRDLVELEQEGALRRVHGGAVIARGRSYEPLYPMRAGVMQAEKVRIGRLAAELVADGDSIALDIGTTTLEVARHLQGRRNLTILTPSLHIANLFMGQPDIRLIVAGGIVRPEEGSLIGDLARHAFQHLYVDRLFLGVACLDAAYGLSEYNWDDALVKRAMIASAKEIVVVADSQKFGKVALVHVADFSQVQKLVTDRAPPTPVLAKLQNAGVSLLVACERDDAEFDLDEESSAVG
jgi:DeoR family transcriptional regulator, fructose operon transcriptional repressor